MFYFVPALDCVGAVWGFDGKKGMYMVQEGRMFGRGKREDQIDMQHCHMSYNRMEDKHFHLGLGFFITEILPFSPMSDVQ